MNFKVNVAVNVGGGPKPPLTMATQPAPIILPAKSICSTPPPQSAGSNVFPEIFIGDTVCILPNSDERTAFFRKVEKIQTRSENLLKQHRVGTVTSVFRGGRFAVRVRGTRSEMHVGATNVLKIYSSATEDIVPCKRSTEPSQNIHFRQNVVARRSVPIYNTRCLSKYRHDHPEEVKLMLMGLTRAKRSIGGSWKVKSLASMPEHALECKDKGVFEGNHKGVFEGKADSHSVPFKSKFFQDAFKNKEVYICKGKKMPKIHAPKSRSKTKKTIWNRHELDIMTPNLSSKRRLDTIRSFYKDFEGEK